MPSEGIDEAVDHVRGPADARLILEYGDYDCPYSRQALRQIERVEAQLHVRFAFRHFPLTEIHPHALGAALAARSPQERCRAHRRCSSTASCTAPTMLRRAS